MYPLQSFSFFFSEPVMFRFKEEFGKEVDQVTLEDYEDHTNLKKKEDTNGDGYHNGHSKDEEEDWGHPPTEIQ